MGQLTRGTIVSEGLLIAGDTSLTTRANVWLNAGLRKLYRSWPWPFLHKRHTGIALASGATSFSFGNGATEALEVARIFDPLSVYASDYSVNQQARIKQFTDHIPSTDEALNNPATLRGIPNEFRMSPSNTVWGTWTLRPSPIPDRALLIALDCLIQPADLSADNLVPIYPNDETLIQLVVVGALQWNDEPEKYQLENGRLDNLMVGDRLRYGSVPGINDQWGLDVATYKWSKVG